MADLEPGTTVLMAAGDLESLVFGEIVSSYDNRQYCVALEDGQLLRSTIPEDAKAILPDCLVTLPEVRAFISREFSRDVTFMRHRGNLTAAASTLSTLTPRNS
jgi:hypothetical protein